MSPPSFIDSGFTTRKGYEMWLADNADATSAPTVRLVVRGMAISHNVIPCVLLAKDLSVGDLEDMNIMTGAHMTPAMLKVNPWHQIPNMTDWDAGVNLGESGAIIRYIANAYAPEKYGGTDAAKKATIDWALEWMSTNFGKNCFSEIWYPVTGFGPAPADQKAANEKALKNLETFAAKFLCGPGKFIGGMAEPSIADYICAIKFHCMAAPVIKAKLGFELPEGIQTYVADFAATSPNFGTAVATHDGFMASKA